MEERDDIELKELNEKESINDIEEDIPNKEEKEGEQEEENTLKKTVSNEIDPTSQGEVKLMSLEEKLKLDVPTDIILNKIDESMNFDILLYTIKDFIIMFILLLSSSFNFNYLYLPFILIGLSYNCLILENKEKSRKNKLVLEIITFIYSFLLLILREIRYIRI